MKPVVVAFAGTSGSGTSVLAARIASILNWPYASFGAYIREEAARRGLKCTRQEQQDIGLELLRDPEAFCRGVIDKSNWRPGQNLIVDGLRHKEIFDALRVSLSPTEVTEIYVNADASLREARLRERGEVHFQGILEIDAHPVEQQVVTALPQLATLTLDAHLPQALQVDKLVEFLIQHAEIPPFHSWMTDENLVRIPQAIRNELKLRGGDRIEFMAYENVLLAMKIVDEDRIRSVFGRLRTQLAGIDPADWVRSIRNNLVHPELPDERSGN